MDVENNTLPHETLTIVFGLHETIRRSCWESPPDMVPDLPSAILCRDNFQQFLLLIAKEEFKLIENPPSEFAAEAREFLNNDLYSLFASRDLSSVKVDVLFDPVCKCRFYLSSQEYDQFKHYITRLHEHNDDISKSNKELVGSCEKLSKYISLLDQILTNKLFGVPIEELRSCFKDLVDAESRARNLSTKDLCKQIPWKQSVAYLDMNVDMIQKADLWKAVASLLKFFNINEGGKLDVDTYLERKAEIMRTLPIVGCDTKMIEHAFIALDPTEEYFWEETIVNSYNIRFYEDIYVKLSQCLHLAIETLIARPHTSARHQHIGDIIMPGGDKDHIEIHGNNNIGKSGENASITHIDKKNEKGWLKPILIAAAGALLAAVVVYFFKINGVSL